MQGHRILIYLFSIPITIYVNFKTLPFSQAKHLPIWVKWNTRLPKLKQGMFEICSERIDRKMISIGLTGSNGTVRGRKTELYLSEDGKLLFYGRAILSEGCVIRAEHGTITFGDRVSANSGTTIWCTKAICFGEQVLIGNDAYLRDDDGHTIIENGVPKDNQKEIKIGSHAWIGAYAKILKGSIIGDGSVVALGSVVTGKHEDHVLLAGVPAKEIRKNICWKHDTNRSQPPTT